MNALEANKMPKRTIPKHTSILGWPHEHLAIDHRIQSLLEVSDKTKKAVRHALGMGEFDSEAMLKGALNLREVEEGERREQAECEST